MRTVSAFSVTRMETLPWINRHYYFRNADVIYSNRHPPTKEWSCDKINRDGMAIYIPCDVSNPDCMAFNRSRATWLRMVPPVLLEFVLERSNHSCS